MSMRQVFTIATAALLLTSCATVDYANSQGGRIRNSGPMSESALQEMAQRECARFGKTAVLTQSGMDNNGTYQRFDCRE
ncbi:hypothetical protein H0Z60_10135 [Ectothiorhodospiraceae bacterium WFHF3C12]|nr:hypothetical protein [Ectothiorhodospiraceae bacterium WFHF3C12]